MRVGFRTGRALSSEKRIRAPKASSDDCLVAHAINRGLSPIVLSPIVQDQREREANRGVRRTMKECIKPGNVIDDDVKECMEGLRIKEW